MSEALFHSINSVLIAPGSFKDVFSSIEVCEMVENILSERLLVHSVPMCDGGENTFEILKRFYGANAEVQFVKDVYNPYGVCVEVPYLIVDETAFIVSSQILHLSDQEDEYKNPLNLTDYGLGQMIKDAVNRKIKKIYLCLGGTSTIGFGLGVGQALGCEYYDYAGEKLSAPIRLNDYGRICSIQWNPTYLNDISVTVINDGITRGVDLERVNPLKIGTRFTDKKKEILSRIDTLFAHVCEITNLTACDPFSGNGGGVYYGIHHIFHPEYVKGTEFFCELFHLERFITEADLIITGEGRYDNPDLEKIPIAVSKLAKKHQKPVVYICGLIGDETGLKRAGITQDASISEKYGIDVMLSCEEDYDKRVMEQYSLPSDYYKQYSPIIIKRRFSQIGVEVK